MSNLFCGLLLLLATASSVWGQSWIRQYTGPILPNMASVGFQTQTQDVQATADGGYVLTAIQDYATGAIRVYPSVIKTDALGYVTWQTSLFGNNGSVAYFQELSVLELPNQQYLVAGLNLNNIYIWNLDASGNVLSTITYQTYCASAGFSNCQTSKLDLTTTQDGNYILAIGGTEQGGTTPNYYTQLLKIAANGSLIWQKVHQQVFTEAVQATFDGGYLLVGNRPVPQNQPILLKLDALGDTSWQQAYGFNVVTKLHDVVQLPDSSFAVSYETTHLGAVRPAVAFMSETGQYTQTTLLLSNVSGLTVGEAPRLVYNAQQQHIAIAGSYIQQSAMSSLLNWYPYATALDLQGNIIGERLYSQTRHYKTQMLSPSPDGGYVLAGAYLGNGGATGFMLKMKSITQAYHELTGVVYEDAVVNCNLDSTDVGLANWLVMVDQGGQQSYATTDQDGRYHLTVDTGALVIRVLPPNILWAPCLDSVLIQSTAQMNQDTIDLGMQAVGSCPLLTVDVSTPLLRICSTAYYTINYCNQGTQPATQSYVDINIDTALTFVNATFSPTNIILGGNNQTQFRFNLGTIQPNTCGSITIETALSCYAQLGATHCVKAHIFPDTTCITSPLWDQSDIDVNGTCFGDSITYKIKNVGVGDMAAQRQYFVTEDHIMLMINPFQLNSGDSILVTIPTTGAIYRLEVEQDPHSPAGAYRALAIQMCSDASGSISAGTFSGLVTEFIEDDGRPAVSVDCQQNVAAWTVNAKKAAPRGYGTTHAIDPNRQLEYHIRFQNSTGGTVQNILVIDTLDPNLDPSTLRMGVSSHPYTWSLSDQGILQIYFNQILLPDLNTDEGASHGFIKFSIQQDPDLPLKTLIHNTAFISFDQYALQQTNTTFHTVDEDFIMDVRVNPPLDKVTLSVYPNPLEMQATVRVNGASFDRLTLRVLDATGRLLDEQFSDYEQEIILKRGKLGPGIYFIQLMGDGEFIGSGKIIIK